MMIETDETAQWDLQVGDPIIAYRSWRIEEHDGLTVLCGIYYRVPWPRRQQAVAECLQQEISGKYELSKHPRHTPPSSPGGKNSHACGFYALKQQQAAQTWFRNAEQEGPVAYGTVALWGRIVPHEHGYRAQYAYPKSISVWIPGLDDDDPEFDAKELAWELEEGYGIPVDVMLYPLNQ